MPRGFGNPRAEVPSSCASIELRPLAAGRWGHPQAGRGFPQPQAGRGFPQPQAGRGFPQPQAGRGFPQPVAIGRRTPTGY
jgi:hypothetical protein